jgi:hypothetical protein
MYVCICIKSKEIQSQCVWVQHNNTTILLSYAVHGCRFDAKGKLGLGVTQDPNLRVMDATI